MTASIRLRRPLTFVACASLLTSIAAEGTVQPSARPIAGSFVVVLKAETGAQALGAPRTPDQVAADLVDSHGGRAERVYRKALHGFQFRGTAAEAEELARDPRVAYVAQDGQVTLAAVQTPSPSWGLDRVDQRGADLDTRYVYYADGAGVDLYVVDTGIRSSHVEFAGRVDTVHAFTAIDDGYGTEDCNGHGTHVAGVAGGATFGVAKGVTLHPVRVVGCDGIGSLTNTLAGIDWITERQEAPGARRAVVNISLNNGFSFALEEAVQASIDAGVVYVAAAGNDGAPASCYLSPQRLPGVITVGASDQAGARWPESNYGDCLDLFAPGTDIVSAFIGGDSESVVMTGTSVAAPHVAGAAALILAAQPQASPDAVQAVLVAAATAGALSDIGPGSPDRLLYTVAQGGEPMLTPVFGDGFESGNLDAWIGDTP